MIVSGIAVSDQQIWSQTCRPAVSCFNPDVFVALLPSAVRSSSRSVPSDGTCDQCVNSLLVGWIQDGFCHRVNSKAEQH